MVSWHRERLISAGFDPVLATTIAADWDVGLHVLLELVDRGWEPRLAARIVGPLHDERRGAG